MRSTSFATVLILAAGLALSASAQPLERAGSPADTRVTRSEHPAPTSAPRGAGFAGEFVTMRDGFENYPVGVTLGGRGQFAPPSSFTGPDGFEWGVNQVLGQTSTAYTTVVDLAGSPVGGNATRAIRITTAVAQPPGGFFTGARVRADQVLVADASTTASASFEYYATSILQSHTVEPTNSLAGFIVSRLYWGGTNETTDLGLPIGPVPTMHFLGLCDTCGFGFFTYFYLARYCVGYNGVIDPDCTPPMGVESGDAVVPPIGAWTRAILEVKPDARFRWSLDLMNGEPPFLIGEDDIFVASNFNQIGSNTSFESQDSAFYFDNAEFSGVLADVPMPPPLLCPYLDDIEWLPLGGFQDSSTLRWQRGPISSFTIVDDGPRGRVVAQTDPVLDNRHSFGFATLLPANTRTTGNDHAVSFEARLTGDAVRAFALRNNSGLVARVFWGNEDRSVPGSPVFTPSFFVQTDGAFDPIDSASGNPDTVQPVVGVHIEDTGFALPDDDDYATITMRLSANGALRVEVNGQRVYTGPASFRGGSVNFLAFESERNIAAFEPSIRVDNIAMTCDAPSCATDFDFDDLTSFSDLNAVLSNFGATGLTGFTTGDANADGVVNFTDLNAVLAAFGTSCK